MATIWRTREKCATDHAKCIARVKKKEQEEEWEKKTNRIKSKKINKTLKKKLKRNQICNTLDDLKQKAKNLYMYNIK